MIILAFFLPCILFLVIGRTFAAIFCFLLQLTIIWVDPRRHLGRLRPRSPQL